MKKFLFFALVALASCTGGNQSVIGKPGIIDYLWSIFMIMGGLAVAIGILLYLIDKQVTSTVKWTISWGVICFIFGLCCYFLS